LDASVKIHKLFGPGLLESVYERLLAVELRKRGHRVECQKAISFTYEGEVFDNAFCVDMIVDNEIVVELKSTGAMNPVYPKQLRTYLVLLGKELGVLINFGMATLKEGFKRVVNNVNLV
jgi:iron complex transport system substrate-binding protein